MNSTYSILILKYLIEFEKNYEGSGKFSLKVFSSNFTERSRTESSEGMNKSLIENNFLLLNCSNSGCDGTITMT